MHRPHEVSDRLDEVLFEDELHLAVFRALVGARTLPEAIDRADPAAATLLQRLAVEEADTDPDDVIALLVERAARRAVAELDAEVRSGSEKMQELSPLIGWVKRSVEELRETSTSVEAATRLVAWLAKRAEEDASD